MKECHEDDINIKDWTKIPPPQLFTLEINDDVEFQLLIIQDDDGIVKILNYDEIKECGIYFIKICINLGYFTHFRMMKYD